MAGRVGKGLGPRFLARNESRGIVADDVGCTHLIPESTTLIPYPSNSAVMIAGAI
jgi:hypothetical protein